MALKRVAVPPLSKLLGGSASTPLPGWSRQVFDVFKALLSGTTEDGTNVDSGASVSHALSEPPTPSSVSSRLSAGTAQGNSQAWKIELLRPLQFRSTSVGN